ncbi:MAG: MerR family transcriptional regulator [Deltaproteobacteria bacterium]|nr:MerR family transcriptional regulator [Deltaproteobacteria bacterium]
MVNIPDKLYFKIGEVSKITRVKPYVLRYWESEFKIVNPQKSKSNQRVYKRKDVELILEIKKLLYNERYTLEGAKAKIRQWLKERNNQQMVIHFPDQRYLKTLKAIREELYLIKGILS